MTREEFIEGYMGRSGVVGFRVDGERVYWGDNDYWCALPCACGEEECDGWAMIPPSGRNWHLFQNTDTEMSGQQAMAADLAWMKANPLRRGASST